MGEGNPPTRSRYPPLRNKAAVLDVIRRAREERWRSLGMIATVRGDPYAEHLPKSEFPGEAIFLFGGNFDRELVRELCSLESLESLSAIGHEIDAEDAKAIAASLTSLTTLYLWDNLLGDEGAKAIATSLAKLTTLALGYNGVRDKGAKAIAASLTSLTTLDLTGNLLGDEAAKAIAASLTALTTLDLRGNQIGDEGAKAIAASLAALTTLYLGDNRVGDEGAKAIAASLAALTTLYLGHNRVGDEGAKAIAASLTSLTSLDLRYNQVGDEGVKALAGSLTSLTTLHLRNNAIGDDAVEAIGHQLTSLVELELSGNGRVSSRGVRGLLDAIGSWPNGGRELHRLLLWECQDLSELFPEELIRGGDAQALLAAYRRSSDREPLNELRLLVVGNEMVGKTSLVRFLTKNKPCDPQEQKTPGIALDEKIEIEHWTPEQSPVRLNIWDFGGQEVMHGTHNYFLTHRSLYLIVLEARREDSQNEALDHWLRVAANRGGHSPVLVVINKAEEGHPYHPDEARWRREFPNVAGFLRTTCRDDDPSRASIQALREAIVQQIETNRALAHVRDSIPTAWLEVKAALDALAEERKTVEYSDYVNLCVDPRRASTRQITDASEQYGLLRLLHHLGVVVAHGLDTEASASPKADVTLLDPNWLTQAIYTLLNSGRLTREHAVFEGQRLGEYLAALPTRKEYQARHYGFITDMMQHPEIALCYQLPEQQGRYLVPAALPDTEPDGFWQQEQGLRFRYTYDLLPASLIPRLIVETHAHLDPMRPTVWKTGVVLCIDGCKVLVRADRPKRLIEVVVFGPERQRRQALSVTRDYLRRVHALHHALREQARVPLPDQPEVTVSYDHLLVLEQEEGPRYSWRPDGAKRKYTITELLDGVRSDSDRPQTAPNLDASDTRAQRGISTGWRLAIGIPLIGALGAVAAEVAAPLLQPDCEEGKRVECQAKCPPGSNPSKLCTNDAWGDCQCHLPSTANATATTTFVKAALGDGQPTQSASTEPPTTLPTSESATKPTDSP